MCLEPYKSIIAKNDLEKTLPEMFKYIYVFFYLVFYKQKKTHFVELGKQNPVITFLLDNHSIADGSKENRATWSIVSDHASQNGMMIVKCLNKYFFKHVRVADWILFTQCTYRMMCV